MATATRFVFVHRAATHILLHIAYRGDRPSRPSEAGLTTSPVHADAHADEGGRNAGGDEQSGSGNP